MNRREAWPWTWAAIFTMAVTPSAWSQESDTCTNFTGLGAPSWSVRNEIAFTGDCGGERALYIFDVEKNELRKVDTWGLEADWPRWSHSGNEIAFTVKIEEDQRDIFLLDVTSGEITQITDDGAHGGIMSWSPDDRWLGIYGPSGDAWNIYRLSLDGTKKIRLNPDDDLEYFNLEWAPNGKSYLYSAGAVIYRQRDGEAKPDRVTPDGISAYMPHWSPDGQFVVFDGDAGDGWELYRIRPDGSELTRLTTNETLDSNASWSPDGKRIVYVCKRSGISTLCILDMESLKPAPLFQP